MPIADLSPQTLQRLRVLAASRGQTLDGWLRQLIEGAPLPADRREAPSDDPLVDAIHDYLARLCAAATDRQAVGAALRAAATDGELCRVGPLGRSGVVLEVSPEPDYVRISGGGGRFALRDATARRLADRLSKVRPRPTLAA